MSDKHSYDVHGICNPDCPGCTIERLMGELSELRKDKARLDWLLERPCRMPIGSGDGFIVQEWIGRTTGRGNTPRAAIDAAMEPHA
jgi:hypothetical protein